VAGPGDRLRALVGPDRGVYIGFAVADGRPRVIAVEAGIAGAFVVVAAAGVTGPAWLLVVGLSGHGFKDLWQHRRHFVANTRWWPPFCLVVDWFAAAILVVLVIVGVDFHHSLSKLRQAQRPRTMLRALAASRLLRRAPLYVKP
jgi:hypothetical protein